jgi:hypothetical protein
VVVNGVTQTANSSGYAYFELKKGTYSYSVSKSGYTSRSGSVTVTSNQILSVVLTSIYPDGLLHLWKLDGNLLDAVGGVNGTADGSITYETGKFSKKCAKLVNSANIRVDLNKTLYQYTVQAWVKCLSLVDGSAIIFSRTSNVNTYGFYFDMYDSRNAIALMATENNNGQIGWNWGTYTNWQLYTFTSDGSSIKCYINGVQQSVKFTYGSAYKYLKFRSNTRIGRDTYSSSRNINGYIQQVMIWDKALSQSEIQKYYNNGNGLEI